MSRRRSSRADSLELLLDTICNTFGGVLFIAILVVLLLQQTGVGPSASTPVLKPLSPLELQAMTTRLETVSAELIRLRQNRDSQDAIVQSFAPEEVRRLLATRGKVTIEQEFLESQIDQLLAGNTALAAQVETLAEENESVRTLLAEAKRRQSAAQAAVDEDRQSRVEQIRLPVIRNELGKTEVGLVMRYGRLYVWHDYGSSKVRRGLNTRDFVVVGRESDGLVTHPNPTRGVPVDDSEACQQAVRQVLLQFDPKTCYLAIVTRPDSYGVFRHVRDRIIELGFEYRLIPVGADDPIADRGGSGGKVQ